MRQLVDLIKRAGGITCDSRLVRPGSVFFAIKGRQADGNHYAHEAEQRGAIAVVTDQQPPALAIPVIVTDNARKSLAAAAAQFYHNPSHNLSVIGVTGTNGKTTTTYMLEHIFRHAGFKPGLIGTVKINTGRESIPSSLTTPDAVSLQKYLAQMRDNGVTHVPIEVSAQGVEMNRTDHICFSCGILSNISPDHLDFHGTFENYIAAKQQFTKLLTDSTPLIVNMSDAYCQAIASQFPGRLITAAVNAQAAFSATVLSIDTNKSSFELITNKNTTVSGEVIAPSKTIIQIPLPGLHNIENALLAAAAAMLHGIPSPVIAAALNTFQGVERRMNVFRVNSLTIVDDTALNPGSIDAVLQSLSAFPCRNIFVINAIRGNRGPAINAANAATIAHWQQKLGFVLAITSSLGDVPNSDIVSSAEKTAFLATLDRLQANYTYFPDLTSAIGTVLDESRSNDLVALLGAQGMDNGRKILISSLTPHTGCVESSPSALQPLSSAVV